MATYIVEAWHPDTHDGSIVTSARLMLRTWDPAKGPKWQHKTFTNTSFDYALDLTSNRKQTVRYAVRVALQQDAVTITHAGETARGHLYVVETAD
jgi:hypothetical protein